MINHTIQIRKTLIILAVAMVAALFETGQASAEPVFFSTSNNVLYRYHLTGTPDTFLLTDEFASMAADPSGTIYMIGRTDIDDDGFAEIYRLDDPCGAEPSLTIVGDYLPRRVVSMSFIGDTLYITYRAVAGEKHYLATVDLVAQTYAVVGQTGATLANINSTGYDNITGKLYGVGNGGTPDLLLIDWKLESGVDPTATVIGPTGQSSYTSGGDFHDGTYYHVVSATNAGVNEILLGTLDLATGAFSLSRVVDSGMPVGDIGLAIIDIPEGQSCPSVGGCCFNSKGQGCEVLTQADCNALEGSYLGHNTTCEDDSDADGITDCFDECPDTPAETPVDDFGCSCAQLGNETPPSIEGCPEDFDVFPKGCDYTIGDYRNSLEVWDDCDELAQLTITQSPEPGTVVGEGQTLVTITVTDTSENSASCEFTITVYIFPCDCDTTPPVIETCGEPVTLQAGVDCTAEVPDLTGGVIAYDECSEPTAVGEQGNYGLTITQNPPAGTPIGIGDTVVTITITDMSDNSIDCEVTVTVEFGECFIDPCENDETPPVIEVCPEPVTLQADETCSASLPDLTGEVIAFDNCPYQEEPQSKPWDEGSNGNENPVRGVQPALTITQDPIAGTPLPVGQTTVTITVTDSSNNSATCEVTVTVEQGSCVNVCGENDQEDPIITTCATDRTLLADSECKAIVPDLTGEIVAIDNCSPGEGLVVTQSPTAGTVIDVGDTLVTITVTDQNGNSSDCTATLTVDANGCDQPINDNNNNNNNDNNNNNNNNISNNNNEGPGPQPVPCDPATDNSFNILFSLLFHAPVCAVGCPLSVALTMCGFLAIRSMRLGSRRRTRRSRK